MKTGDGGQTLTLLSQMRDNYAVFQYENKKQDINQKFGVNLKYYKEHQEKFPWLKRADLPPEQLTKVERQNMEHSSGAYTFLP